MKPRIPRRLGRCLAVVACAAAAAWAAPGKPLADVMPRQTLAVVEMPPLKVVWENFQKNLAPDFVDEDLKKAWAKLWEGKWERELRDMFGVQPLDFVLTYPQRMGVVFGELGALAEAAAADKTPTPDMVQIAFCLDGGTGKEEFAKAFEKFLESGVEQARKKGRKTVLRRENYHNAPYFVICVEPPAEGAKDGAAAGKDLGLFIAWVDTWLVATPSKAFLEKILDVREGAPALNANESYRVARDTLKWKDDDFTAYADVRPLYDLFKNTIAKQAGATEQKNAQLALDIMDQLFGEVTTVAAKGGYVDKGAASEYFIACDQGRQPGLLHLLGRKDGLSFPAWTWADENAVQFTSALDAKFLQSFVSKLLTTIYKTQFDVSMAEAWRTQFSAFFMGVDLEKDLLGSIGERVTVVVSTKEPPAKPAPANGAPKPAARPDGGEEDDEDDALDVSGDAAMSDFLIALELQKAEAWQTVLGQLTTMTRGTLEQTEYLGRKFFVFADMPGMKLLGGVADGMLLLGSRDMLEQLVRRIGKDVPGLTADARFKDLAPGAGAPNAFIGHAAKGSFGIEELRNLWDMAESQLAADVGALKDPLEKELADGLLNLVREALKDTHWKNIAPQSIGGAAWEERGLRVRSLERWVSAKAAASF
jgi:hypothetical protein